ncbi:MAG: cytochrome c [Planctomycetes bacterium]|nr:cytochrome c [Planctomycetota bacterium]
MRFSVWCVGVLLSLQVGATETSVRASRRATVDATADATVDAACGELAEPKSASAGIERLKSDELPNPIRVHERVISGGLPEGDAAFAELQALGIKTIISVDGTRPDVARARKYGMRYVHLPHGYDGISAGRAQELVKAVRDLPGPIYLHCHHGKHRSPTAAAVACVGAGFIAPQQAVSVLELAGTSPAYRGLFQAAREARPLDQSVIDRLPADFPEVAKLPAIAEAMVEMEQVHDRLKLLEQAGWQAPAQSPSLEPAHEALLLREHFTEFLRRREVLEKPAKFVELAREAEAACRTLEAACQGAVADTKRASQALQAVSTNCRACHQMFRDVPLSDK